MKRIVVTGGRDYADRHAVARALDAVQRKHGIALLIEGGAKGADRLCAEWARDNSVPAQRFAANWSAYGKGAGHIRNQQMIDEGRPDAAIAFPGGRGTADMTRRLQTAGIPVWVIR
jgi:predicted Rossmann-fold nucleotide-binding protein